MKVRDAGRSPVEDWAVVVPAYRHIADTILCLASLRSASPTPETVIVVDDGSGDDSIPRLRRWAAREGLAVHVVDGGDPVSPPGRGLTIVASPVNEGFTCSSNRGLKAASEGTDAPFVLLLNNDAVVTRSFFEELARAAHAHPRAGLLTGTIYEWDRSTVWFSGGRIDHLRALAANDTTSPRSTEPYATEWISGCAMLIAREALERVGVLPACFSPCYSEDVDYSLRVRAAGMELVVAPGAVAYHRVGASLGRDGAQPPHVTYVSSRNRAFVVRRNYRGWRRATALGYLALTKPMRAAVETLRGRPRTGWAVLAGTVDGMFNPAAKT